MRGLVLNLMPVCVVLGISVVAGWMVTSSIVPLWLPPLLVAACLVALRWGLRGWVTLSLLALVFVPFRGMFSYYTEIPYLPAEMIAAQAIQAGSIENRVAIVLLFAVGLLLILQRPSQLRGVNLIPWAVGYLALAFASSGWSADPALTLRRSAAAAAVMVFAAGIGAIACVSRPSHDVSLFRVIVWTGFAVGLSVLLVEATAGGVNVFDPSWRLGPLGMENQTAWVMGLAFIVAYVTRLDREVWRSRLLSMVLTAMLGLMLVATKSRFGLLGVTGAVVVCELLSREGLRMKSGRILAIALLFGFVATMIDLRAYLARGEEAELLWNLSGRIPLWARVWNSILESSSLLWGSGYGAFWTAPTVLDLASDWVPTSAHAGFLDQVANLGLIGLGLLLSMVVVSIRNGLHLLRSLRFTRVGLVLVCVYTAVLLISVGESMFQTVYAPPMVALWILSFYASKLRALSRWAL